MINYTSILSCTLLLLASCSSSSPRKDRPWSLILAQAPTHDSAEALAEQLSKNDPLLEDLMAVTVRDKEGGIRHLILSRGVENPTKLQKLKKALVAKAKVRLRELDIRKVQILDSKIIEGSLPPEGSDIFEHMAQILPNPGDYKLKAFSIVKTGKEGKTPPPKIPTVISAKKLSEFFRSSGFFIVGQAEYSSGASDSRATVLVGFVDSADAGNIDLRMKRIYNFLLDYKVKVLAQSDEKERNVRKTHERRRRNRRWRAKKRAYRKGTRAKEMKQIPLVPILKDLPPASSVEIASEKLDVYELEGIDLKKKNRSVADLKEIPTLTAWLWHEKGSNEVVLWLFDDREMVKRLNLPCTLGDRVGLSLSVWVSAIWEALPEVTLESELLEFISYQDLETWVNRPVRKLPLLGSELHAPVFSAGYSSKDKNTMRWQASWIKLSSKEKAKKFYEIGLLAPRQKRIKRILDSKRNISYDVGLTLHEVGDVQAWLLTGSSRGWTQEVFFTRGRDVWLITSGVPVHGGLTSDELLGRIELLSLWDLPNDK